MADPPPSPPTPAVSQVLDDDFLEHRAKLLDLAAFLDRLDRASTAHPEDAPADPRLPALRAALAILQDDHPQCARRVLEAWSDHTPQLLDAAPSTPVIGVPQTHRRKP